MLSEEELIVAIKNRTKAGAEALYDSYGLMVYKIICCKTGDAELAEQILAKVFQKIWTSFDEFHEQQNRLSVWVMGTARSFSKMPYTETLTIRDRNNGLDISTKRI